MKLILKEGKKKPLISENLKYHLKRNKILQENIFRVGSQAWCELVCEVRSLYKGGFIELNEDEKYLVESDAGSYGYYLVSGENTKVPLDAPNIHYTSKNGTNIYEVFTLDENNEVVRVLFTENMREFRSLMLESIQYDQEIKKISKFLKENSDKSIAQKLKAVGKNRWLLQHLNQTSDETSEVSNAILNDGRYKLGMIN